MEFVLEEEFEAPKGRNECSNTSGHETHPWSRDTHLNYLGSSGLIREVELLIYLTVN
jgi:hypothetical protein